MRELGSAIRALNTRLSTLRLRPIALASPSLPRPLLGPVAHELEPLFGVKILLFSLLVLDQAHTPPYFASKPVLGHSPYTQPPAGLWTLPGSHAPVPLTTSMFCSLLWACMPCCISHLAQRPACRTQ